MIDLKNYHKIAPFLLLAGMVLLLATAQPATAAPDGYWQLEETDPGTSGVVDDMGVVNGTCTTCPTSTTGQVNNGFDFSVAGAQVDIPDNAIFDFAATAGFSIELWMKIASAPASRQVMIGRFESGGAYWWLAVEPNGTIAAQFRDSDGPSPSTIATSTNVADNLWHHVAAVLDRDAGRISIYVDSNLNGTQNLAAANSGDFGASSSVNLGHFNTGFQYSGQLDNVAIYGSTALSADAVLQNFNLGTNGYSLTDEYAPTYSGSRNETAAVGFSATFTPTLAGNPLPHTYASTNLPAGATIDGTTGIITWLPRNNQVGTNTFAVSATNTQGTGSQDWNVEVTDLCVSALDSYWKLEENGGPFSDDTAVVADATCTNCPTQVAGKVGFGQSFDGADDSVDVPANSVFDWAANASFSIELWMKIASAPASRQVMIGRFESGGAYWWLAVEPNGSIVVQFRDSDGPSPSTITTSTNVGDDGWHHVVAVLDRDTVRILIYVDGELEGTQDLTAANNGDFGASSSVNIGHFNGGFLFGGSLDEVATYNLALTDTMVEQHFNADVGQSYCNQAPTIDESTAVTTATEGVAYTYTAVATDPEGHDITWSLTTAPSGMAVDAATGVVTWTPDSNATATEDVVIQATDTYGATDVHSFTIDVTFTDNSAPVIAPAPASATSATVGTAYSYDAEATDADGDTLTWSLEAGAPTGMSVDPATGLVSWTPAEGSEGDVTYTLVVNDGKGGTASQPVTVTVSAAGTVTPAASDGGGGGGGCFITSLF